MPAVGNRSQMRKFKRRRRRVGTSDDAGRRGEEDVMDTRRGTEVFTTRAGAMALPLESSCWWFRRSFILPGKS